MGSRMKIFFLFLFSSFSFISFSQSPTWQWAKSFGGTANETLANNIVCDNSTGDVYMAGSFLSPTLPFDTVTLNYNNGSVFITKLDKDGNTIWAKNFGKISSGIDIALDSINGDIVVTGTFWD